MEDNKSNPSKQTQGRIVIRISDSIPQPISDRKTKDAAAAIDAATGQTPLSRSNQKAIEETARKLWRMGTDPGKLKQSINSSSATLTEKDKGSLLQISEEIEKLNKVFPQTTQKFQSQVDPRSQVEVQELAGGEPPHIVHGLQLQKTQRGVQVAPSETKNPQLYNSQYLNQARRYSESLTNHAQRHYQEYLVTTVTYQEPDIVPPNIGSTPRTSGFESGSSFTQGSAFQTLRDSFQKVAGSASTYGSQIASNAVGAAKISSQNAIKQGLNKLASGFQLFLARARLYAKIAKWLILAFFAWLTTVIITTIIWGMGFIALTIVILIIINSGAYVVPPGGFTGDFASNPSSVIRVTKTANPSGRLPNGQQMISYEVNITSSSDTITNISVNDNCVILPNGTCPPMESIRAGLTSSLPSLTPYSSFTALQSFISSVSIGGSDPFVITYTRAYNLSDATASDFFNVTGTVAGQGETGTGRTSSCFGNCPSGCFEFVGTWPSSPRFVLEQAILNVAGQHPTYMGKVCSAGTIRLGYDESKVLYCGWFANGQGGSDVDIWFAARGGCLINLGVTEYLLAHEIAHYLATYYPGAYQSYLDDTAFNERPICTYVEPNHPASEDFAEIMGLYVNDNLGSTCIPNGFAARYPISFEFARCRIFEEGCN